MNNEMIDRGIEKIRELVGKTTKPVYAEDLWLIFEAMKEKQICPLCKTQLIKAPGIGYYCPNKECIVSDDADLYNGDTVTEKEKSLHQEVLDVLKKAEDIIGIEQSLWDSDYEKNGISELEASDGYKEHIKTMAISIYNYLHNYTTKPIE